MFCPQCGQQQVSDEVRFCSRCGFQLEAVTGLMKTRGVPAAEAVTPAPYEESPRRKGARTGGKLILIGIFLIPMMLILHALFRLPEEIGLLGVLCMLGGFLRLIYALIFEQGPYRRSNSQMQPHYAPPNMLTQTPRALSEAPPAQGAAAHAYVPPRHDTSEIAYRPSVTESTTRLLSEQDDERRR
jgi:hypothetical protein